MSSVQSTMLEKVRSGRGFIAALDQSGGSTPKALALYGVEADAYSNDDEMFTRVHEMRTRIITDASFNNGVINCLLFHAVRDVSVIISAVSFCWPFSTHRVIAVVEEC